MGPESRSHKNPPSSTLRSGHKHNEQTWPLIRLFTKGRDHARQIGDLANIQKGDQVVELGSGYPFMHRLYSKRVGPTGNFYAVDINEVITKRSKKISRIFDTIFPLRRARGREVYMCADANNLQFEDNTIDIVIASNLTSGETPESERNNSFAYAEAFRVLKPGGKIITSFTDEIGSYRSQNIDVRLLQKLGFTNIERRDGTEMWGRLINRFVLAEKPKD